ncbi:J domain-containing protein [Pragia fontium]|uniref:J domain-containing protein n=1 Tax=Pragia fontium DSM 5563 = ATCC 49100 TaxID=1122977 RepID=A0AAJ4WDD9_9GAMM|nr:J domain-containing protein [Pragia fontium]SFD40011.1 Protein of unknown function [Pragia fontium DSM 5563 = ATCC 49100]VEJ52726.1 Uncharacterised protein [Pragia fontium]
MSQSCWEILGIEPTNDQDIIRNAYRQKLPEYHPESDPQGFQNLRQAFEQAKKGIQSDFTPISALSDGALTPVESDSQENGEENQPPETAEPHPEQPAIDQLTADFDALLNNPQKRYQPDAWHEYIQELDKHSIEVVNQLRWPLLQAVYNASFISRNCALILAERLRWKQRLNELQDEHAHSMDEYLDFIAKGDILDLTLLSDLPLAAQNASFDHISSIHFLFWERPAWMLRAYLEQPSAVYWPDTPELMERRCRWYTYAGFGYPELSDYCLQRLTDEPDNIDWLYLYASQCSLNGDDQQALPYWIRLYTLERHAAAEAWLLNWCKTQAPERLPLLIQAMDNPLYAPADSIPIDSPDQCYLTPAQTTKTLLRWGDALQYPLPQLAQDYANWKLYKETQTTILRHLVEDDGSDPVLHLYRHASMLRLGNETLLQQIIDEPLSDDPLDKLILEGLKHLAQQRLTWLENSQVIATFSQWLYAPTAEQLPEIFNDRDADIYQQCLHWLLERRWMADEQLERLVNSEQFGNNLEIITDWVSFIALQNSTSLPPPVNGEDYWEWCRKCYALVLLLEKPAESLAMIMRMKNLHIEEQHPLHPFWQIIQSIDPEQGDIVEQYMNKLTLSNILQHHSWTRLPITPQDYLDNSQTNSSYSIDHFYISSTPWREQIAKSNQTNQMVFYAACAYFGLSSRTERFTGMIEEMVTDEPTEATLKESLLNAKPYPLAKNILNPRLLALINEIIEMRRNERHLMSEHTHQLLLDCQQNVNEDITLRLVAKLLLQEFNYRRKKQTTDETKPASVWAFWRVNTRLNRTGFMAQLFCGSIFAFMIAYLLTHFSSTLDGQIILTCLLYVNIACAATRRLNDLDHGKIVNVLLTVVAVVFPISMLYLLLAPGVPFANKAGPPASGWFNQT